MNIYETAEFVVEAAERPHVTRTDGGHVRIIPKTHFRDRTELSPATAIQLMRLTMAVGEAMRSVLPERGIDLGRINYQENGNWGVRRTGGPYLHVHLYGRAVSATRQPYGEALYFPSRESGFYEDLEPLTDGDVHALRERIERLLQTPKYRESAWNIGVEPL